MTTIQSKDPYNRSFEMAEDNMEISSEFGGERIVEDDIDIDIDFAPEHHDEDHMLDDITSEVDNDIRMQRSPAVVNDDIMLDEDNASVPMDDADFTQEQHQLNLQPEGTQVFEIPDQASTDAGADSGASGFLEQNISGFNGNDAVPSQPTWPETEQLDLHAEDGPSEQTWDNGAPVESGPTLTTAEEQTVESAQRDEIEQNLSTEVPTTRDEQPPSSDATLQPRDESSHENQFTDSDRRVPHEGDAPGNHEDSRGEQNDSDEILSEKVIVVYQGSEYALTRATENDDPDSFFLNDHSLIYEPLSKMFEALREVLVDEISVDDELYLEIEELGLDTNETSASAYNTTFSQIVDLHDMLHRNDGVDTPGTLFVTLGSKPNFSKKFATLVKNASEGKGFSDIVRWDDESHNIDDVNASGETRDGNGPSFSEAEHGDANGSATENGSHEVVENQDQNEAAVAESDLKTKESSEVEGTRHPSTELADNDGPGEHVTAPETEDNGYPQTTGYPLEERNDVAEEEKEDEAEVDEDEDGDLIDYEDEEYEESNKTARTTQLSRGGRIEDGTLTDLFTPCLKPDTCFCSRCNELLLAEYEAINEELRRRSLSRATDEDDQASYRARNLSTAANLNSEVVAHQPLTDDTENVVNLENNVDHANHEEDSHFDDENRADAPPDETYVEESVADTFELPHNDNADEIDYDHGLENVEAFESNESENTLVGDDAIKYPDNDDFEEPHDEIDYEDDDHLELNDDYQHDAEKESPTSNANSGKRAREGEDTLDEDLQEPKRVRS